MNVQLDLFGDVSPAEPGPLFIEPLVRGVVQNQEIPKQKPVVVAKNPEIPKQKAQIVDQEQKAPVTFARPDWRFLEYKELGRYNFGQLWELYHRSTSNPTGGVPWNHKEIYAEICSRPAESIVYRELDREDQVALCSLRPRDEQAVDPFTALQKLRAHRAAGLQYDDPIWAAKDALLLQFLNIYVHSVRRSS